MPARLFTLQLAKTQFAPLSAWILRLSLWMEGSRGTGHCTVCVIPPPLPDCVRRRTDKQEQQRTAERG